MLGGVGGFESGVSIRRRGGFGDEVSRFFKAARAAESLQSAIDADWAPESRPFKVISVTSNKGGVGKTTLASNLAVYIRALREDLPILILTFDDQNWVDRMFSLGSPPPSANLIAAVRSGDLSPAIVPGQFGIHYVPASEDAAQLKQTTTSPFHLQRVLQQTDWHGLVIIDTRVISRS